MLRPQFSQRRILSTIGFAGSRCIISFNALIQKTTFSFVGDKLMTAEGREVEIPPAARRRVLDTYFANPEWVLLVEHGPQGPIAEHSIVPAAATGG